MEIVERAHPIVTRDRAEPARPQFISKEHGRRFRQPMHPLFMRRVLERDDQDPAVGWTLRHSRRGDEEQYDAIHEMVPDTIS